MADEPTNKPDEKAVDEVAAEQLARRVDCARVELGHATLLQSPGLISEMLASLLGNQFSASRTTSFS